uniref:RxLR effector candidate protein n=1 Tax=Hyaloperonospora arabidopsidis (strain Emoy2) TaxID=559515 RepID=M4BG38_HYAAE|nr:RxLR effector candidate protein [Hyaloperonospora arabidopsidis Emoy2]
MRPKTGATEATSKKPGGFARATPRRGLPSRVPSSVKTPAAVEDSSARESETRDDKILAAPAGVMERLAVLESSQRVRDEDERMMGAVESGMFTSELGANMHGLTMTIDALGAPEENPAAPLTLQRAPDLGVSCIASLEPPGARLPPPHYTPMHKAPPPQQAAPLQAYERPGLNGYEMPTVSQCKINIRKFDGTELYKGHGSSFCDWDALSCVQ